MLKGRLLILLERFSDAQDSFAEVTDAFLPIRDELERTIKAHRLESYFQKKVGDNITDIDMTTLVPKVAADAVETELNADEAMVLVQKSARKDAMRQPVELLGSFEMRSLRICVWTCFRQCDVIILRRIFLTARC